MKYFNKEELDLMDDDIITQMEGGSFKSYTLCTNSQTKELLNSIWLELNGYYCDRFHLAF